MKTIFCDIDGTLVVHKENSDGIYDTPMEILPGVKEKLLEWEAKQYNIILTTGRKESHRKSTEKQLRSVGIRWDQLIMGIHNWDRILINDHKDSTKTRARAYSVNRNTGDLSKIEE
jgi:histidinol phosphatase-like enzyme